MVFTSNDQHAMIFHNERDAIQMQKGISNINPDCVLLRTHSNTWDVWLLFRENRNGERSYLAPESKGVPCKVCQPLGAFSSCDRDGCKYNKAV